MRASAKKGEHMISGEHEPSLPPLQRRKLQRVILVAANLKATRDLNKLNNQLHAIYSREDTLKTTAIVAGKSAPLTCPETERCFLTGALD